MKMKIQEVFNPHQVWLKDKTKGIQADFSDMDLRGADFSDADLMFVDFSDTDLRFADFSRADLNDANLRGADLGSTNLTNAKWDGLHFPETQDNRITNYYKGVVFCGCFEGNLAEFKESVNKKKNDCPRKKAYLEIIKQIENEK